MDNKPINPKRQAFCREYVVDHNGTQAAIRAGYSKKTASTQADQLLHILEVKQEIGRIDAETRQKSVATRKIRQEFWTDTMQNAPNMIDRLRASELLGRSEADFTDNINDNREGLHITVNADKPGPKLAKEAFIQKSDKG